MRVIHSVRWTGRLILGVALATAACSGDKDESAAPAGGASASRTVRIELAARSGDRARLGLRDDAVALVGFGAFDSSGRKVMARQLKEGVNEIELPVGKQLELRGTLFFLKDDGGVFLSTSSSRISIGEDTESVALAFGPWQKNERRNVHGLVLEGTDKPAAGAGVTLVEPYSQAVVAAPGDEHVAKADANGRFTFSYPFPLDETRSRLALRISHGSKERNVEAAPADRGAKSVALPPLVLDGSAAPAFGGAVDFDGDGDDDATELRLGTNPFDPLSIVKQGDKGDKGEAGAPGIVLSERFATDTACAAGGVRLRSFADKDSNGAFDAAIDGAASVTVLCDGAAASPNPSTGALAIHDANGTRIGAAIERSGTTFLQVGATLDDRARLQCNNGFCRPESWIPVFYPTHGCSGSPIFREHADSDPIHRAPFIPLAWAKEGFLRVLAQDSALAPSIRSRRDRHDGPCLPHGAMGTNNSFGADKLLSADTLAGSVRVRIWDTTSPSTAPTVLTFADADATVGPNATALRLGPSDFLVHYYTSSTGWKAMRSTDGGTTWSVASLLPGSGAYRAVPLSTGDLLLVAGNNSIQVGPPDLSSWTNVGNFYTAGGSFMFPTVVVNEAPGGKALVATQGNVWFRHSASFDALVENSAFGSTIGMVGAGLRSDGSLLVLRSDKKVYASTTLSSFALAADLSVPLVRNHEFLAATVLGTAPNDSFVIVHKTTGTDAGVRVLDCPVASMPSGCQSRGLLGYHGANTVAIEGSTITLLTAEGYLRTVDRGMTWTTGAPLPSQDLSTSPFLWRGTEVVPFAGFGAWTLPFKMQ